MAANLNASQIVYRARELQYTDAQLTAEIDDAISDAVAREREACAKIAETYKHKADMRAGIHEKKRNQLARDSALDKFEAALEIETEIRARSA